MGEECREPEHGFEQGRDVVNYSREIYQLQPESEWGEWVGAVLVKMLLSASNRNPIQRGLNIEENTFSSRIHKVSMAPGWINLRIHHPQCVDPNPGVKVTIIGLGPTPPSQQLLKAKEEGKGVYFPSQLIGQNCIICPFLS